MDVRDLWEHEARDAADAMYQVMADCGRDPGGSATHPARTRAVEACDRALARIEDAMVAPMTDSARRYVELFTSRDNVTAADVESALEAFGGQHAAARAIIEHARGLGIACPGSTRDETQHYAFELVRDSCRTLSFKDERDRREDERDGYRMLMVAVADWANWIKGRESFLGNDMGPLRVPANDAGVAQVHTDVSGDVPAKRAEGVPGGLRTAFSRAMGSVGLGDAARHGGDES